MWQDIRQTQVQLKQRETSQKEAVLASKKSIVTVEEIVDDFGPRNLNAVIIPSWALGAIAVVPGGAFPSYAQRFVPLLPYMYAGLDRVWAQIAGQGKLATDDVRIDAKPRGDAALSRDDLRLPD